MRNMNQNMGNCNSNRDAYKNRPANVCEKKCQCEDKSTKCNDPLRGMPIGIGYVPWQTWGRVYDYAEGLSRGTIFPPLDLPFYGCIPRGFHTNKGGNA